MRYLIIISKLITVKRINTSFIKRQINSSHGSIRHSNYFIHKKTDGRDKPSRNQYHLWCQPCTTTIHWNHLWCQPCTTTLILNHTNHQTTVCRIPIIILLLGRVVPVLYSIVLHWKVPTTLYLFAMILLYTINIINTTIKKKGFKYINM